MRAGWRWAALAALVAAAWILPLPRIPLCGFRWLTGRPCPLCGLTHALYALAHGRVGEAIHWHALSPLVALLIVGVVWNPPKMARLWMPSAVAFGIYGLWRIVTF
jgi:hypothetical protein